MCLYVYVCVCVCHITLTVTLCYFPLKEQLNKQSAISKIRLEQSVSVNNDMKKQQEAKEEVLRSKNKEKKTNADCHRLFNKDSGSTEPDGTVALWEIQRPKYK